MKRFLILLLCLLSLSCASRSRRAQRQRDVRAYTTEERSLEASSATERAAQSGRRASGTHSTPASSRREMSGSEIFKKYAPAVFRVYVSGGYKSAQGSGFFISRDGIAVSNYHVFEGTTKGYEQIVLNDGTTCKVEHVYHYSKEQDFIIFKVAICNEVSYIPLASSSPLVGERVYTIGSPRELHNTFSSGEVSQLRDGGDIIQINAPIDHGSSGGVLLNSYGEAIGITSSGYEDSPANLNFAINISIIKPYIPRI